jgi:hypothetical protein
MVSPDANRFTPGTWLHPACFVTGRAPGAPESYAEALNAILPELTGAGTMRVPAGRLRTLLRFLGELVPQLEPARRPDWGKIPPSQSYRHLAGWSRARVMSGTGMTPALWMGFWTDHLDVGRCPLIRRDALRDVLQAAEDLSGEYLVWARWPLSERRDGALGLIRHTPESAALMLERSHMARSR